MFANRTRFSAAEYHLRLMALPRAPARNLPADLAGRPRGGAKGPPVRVRLGACRHRADPLAARSAVPGVDTRAQAML